MFSPFRAISRRRRGKNDKKKGREGATENLNASVTKEIAVNPSLFGSYSLAVRKKKTETGLLNPSHVYVYVYVYVYAPESKAVLMLSITLVICLLNIWQEKKTGINKPKENLNDD